MTETNHHEDPLHLVDVLLVAEDPERGNAAETLGLHDHGFPELEIAHVNPAYLLPAAAALLHDISAYMLDAQQSVQSGETMLVGPTTAVRFAQVELRPDGGQRLGVLALDPWACPLCEGVDHNLWPQQWSRLGGSLACAEPEPEAVPTDAPSADGMPN